MAMKNSTALPDVKISQLRCLVAVAEEHGFKAAAERLFKSQPAVSIAVKELEKTLGVALFEKGTGSQLTPYGESVCRIAHQLLDEYQRSVQAMAELADGRKGSIRFASVPSLARAVLPYAIEPFVARHPDVDIHMSDGDTAFVRKSVLSGDVDFGFCGESEPDNRLVYKEIFHDRMGIVCSKRHPLANLKQATWKHLKNERLIGNGTMDIIRGRAREAIDQHDRFYFPNTTSLLAVVQANMGITILPQLVLSSGATEELRYIPLANPIVTRSIGILTLARRSLSPAGQLFYGHVLDALGQVKF